MSINILSDGKLIPAPGEFLAQQAIDAVPSKAALAAYANLKQWRLATGGFTGLVLGVPRLFDTGTVGQALITGKQLRLQQAGAPSTVNWQFGTDFVAIPAADFTATAILIADFVQATFDALQTTLAAISTGSIASFAAIDAAGWPANHV